MLISDGDLRKPPTFDAADPSVDPNEDIPDLTLEGTRDVYTGPNVDDVALVYKLLSELWTTGRYDDAYVMIFWYMTWMLLSMIVHLVPRAPLAVCNNTPICPIKLLMVVKNLLTPLYATISFHITLTNSLEDANLAGMAVDVKYDPKEDPLTASSALMAISFPATLFIPVYTVNAMQINTIKYGDPIMRTRPVNAFLALVNNLLRVPFL